jgi:hypothetical protein
MLQGQADQRGHGAETEDQPPVHGARSSRRDLQDDQRHDIGDQDADRDHPLLEHAERAAPSARRVLRDVGGGDGRVGPDGQADQGPGDEQDGRVGGDRRQDRAHSVDERVGDQQGLTAQPVRRQEGQDRPGRSAQRGTCHQIAQPEAAQVVGHEVERRPDVRGVVAEQEAAQAGQDGQLPVERRGLPLVEHVKHVGPGALAGLGLRHAPTTHPQCPAQTRRPGAVAGTASSPRAPG